MALYIFIISVAYVAAARSLYTLLSEAVRHEDVRNIPTTVPGGQSFLRARCPTVVIHSRSCSVVSETIVVVVDLTASLLEHRDNVIERAKAVWILGATIVVADGDDGIVTARTH